MRTRSRLAMMHRLGLCVIVVGALAACQGERVAGEPIGTSAPSQRVSSPWADRRTATDLSIPYVVRWPTPTIKVPQVEPELVIPLDNPRGVALGSDGVIYIADSGNPDEPLSGRIVLVRPGGDLIEEPFEFGGIVGSASGEAHYFGLANVAPGADGVTALLGLGAWLNDPLYSDNRLISIAPDGSVSDVFDVGGYERDSDPDGVGGDSNASGLAVADDGIAWVTDAAGNWAARLIPSNVDDGLLEVSTVAVFPTVDGEDAVPTGIAVGPDGNAYVALFRCQQPTAGKGGIAQVLPDGSYEIVATDLSNPIDVAFDASGRMYVLEFAVDYAPETGRLLRVEPDGQAEVVLDGLTFPTSLAVSDEGDVYITEIASPAGGPAGSGRLLIYDSLIVNAAT